MDSHTNPHMVQIHLKKSKCDQVGKGSDIVLGTTGSALCPVNAIACYLSARGDRPGPFFLDSSHDVVTKPRFIAQIRSILSAIGLPQHHYAGHSFRAGAATTAALAGVEDSTIQTLGRWHSSAFLQYIHTPKERLAALSAVLAQPHPGHACSGVTPNPPRGNYPSSATHGPSRSHVTVVP